MSQQTKNSYAKAFGNRSRNKNLRPIISRGGGQIDPPLMPSRVNYHPSLSVNERLCHSLTRALPRKLESPKIYNFIFDLIISYTATMVSHRESENIKIAVKHLCEFFK